MFRYERLHGDYALVDDHGKAHYFSPSIAIGYDPVNFVMHKHGPPGLVHEWATDTRLKAKGIFEVAVIESDRWDVEDLNRMLSITGYLGVFMERLAEEGKAVDISC